MTSSPAELTYRPVIYYDMSESVVPPYEPRWRRLPKERPAQIVRAALEAFGELGLAGARLDDIARRAGLSKGTIYLYFPNKEELFREVVRTVIVGQIEQERAQVGVGDPRHELERYLRSYWAFARTPDFQAISRMVHGEIHQFPDLALFYGREVVTPANALLASVIRRGTETGVFREVDPTLAARALSALVITHALWSERRHAFGILTDTSDETILEHLLDFAIHAVAAPTTGTATPPRRTKARTPT